MLARHPRCPAAPAVSATAGASSVAGCNPGASTAGGVAATAAAGASSVAGCNPGGGAAAASSGSHSADPAPLNTAASINPGAGPNAGKEPAAVGAGAPVSGGPYTITAGISPVTVAGPSEAFPTAAATTAAGAGKQDERGASASGACKEGEGWGDD